MIPVVAQPEPAHFDTSVRRKGLKYLKNKGFSLGEPLPPKADIPPYWRECLTDLHHSYAGICAYLYVDSWTEPTQTTPTQRYDRCQQRRQKQPAFFFQANTPPDGRHPYHYEQQYGAAGMTEYAPKLPLAQSSRAIYLRHGGFRMLAPEAYLCSTGVLHNLREQVETILSLGVPTPQIIAITKEQQV